LVPALAAEVARGLGLPFHTVVVKAKETAPQKEMDNSAQQYANVADAFSIAGPVPAGPVLLIDDIVDSRWTLTVIAAQLRQNGSGPVFPVVLARALSD
jgi:ATP-dependent DNA helicase RecQ